METSMAIEISVEALKECFADLPDPRVVERTSHSLGIFCS
jgi:hypothetical protein